MVAMELFSFSPFFIYLLVSGLQAMFAVGESVGRLSKPTSGLVKLSGKRGRDGLCLGCVGGL
jgi:hypothetical protein